ncbi:MAG: hypothetical protein ACHP65_09575 [Legionellales bacterium]
MNYSELLHLDPDSITIDTDFALFLKRRAALIETALLEGNGLVLEDILRVDQQHLLQLKKARVRIENQVVNLSKIIQYGISN